MRREDFISALFGKPFEALTCREVCEKLEAIYESDRVEFKESFEKEEKLREELLRTVVGFLNTAERYGLIVLGASDPGRPGERVRCLDKDKNLFKWDKAGQVEAHIRDTILENLKTTPRAITPPHLGVRVFDCRSDCGLGRDGWLILVYIERISDAVYYSKIDNTAYTRRASTTQPLSLEETFALVESKRKPIVILLLEPQISYTLDSTILDFTMWLRNIGYKPATQVACKFYTYKKLMVPGDPQRAIPIKWLMVNNEIVTFPVKKEDPRVMLEFFNIYPRNPPVFPRTKLSQGRLRIILDPGLLGQATVTVEADIYTEETVTRERYYINIHEDGKFEHVVSLRVRDYLGSTILKRDNWKVEL